MLDTTILKRAGTLALVVALGAACSKSAPKDKSPTEVNVSKAQAEAAELGVAPQAWIAYQEGVAHLEAKPARPEEALASFLAAADAEPEFAEAYYNAAMIYERQGQADKAREFLERARNADPDQSEYKVAMGRLYASTGEFDQAKVLFEEVMARDPANLEARNNLAVLALKREDLDRAKELAIDILREDDDNVPALTTLGLIYKKQENLSLAKYVFNKATTIDKKNADVYNNLGLVFMMEDDTPKAVTAFQLANDADQSYLESRLNLGALLLEYLDYERADAQFTQAISIAPEHCVANLGKGATQYALGKFEAAAERYRYYVGQCDAEHVSSFERMAKLYEGPLKNPDEAISAYRKLLSLSTDAEKQTEYKAMITFLEGEKNKPPEPAAPEVGEDEDSVDDEGEE